MGRYRSRSRSYTPRRRTPSSPRRKRYDDVRDRRHHHYRRESSAPSGLLVRNVALDTQPEDLRIPFEKFGPVKDVYLPKNYYTGEPRGFAFVKFRFAEDAAEAKDRLNHTVIGGREIRIVYAEENRKTPQEMRKSARVSGSYGGRRRASPRSPRRRYHSSSRSPPPERRHPRSISRSRSPHRGRYNRSPERSMTPLDHSADGRDHRRSVRSPKERSPRDEKKYKSTKRSHSSAEMSPRDEKYNMSRDSPHSREISPHDSKDLRSSRRSVSPRKESSFAEESKAKHRASNARDGSSPEEDYRTNKSSIHFREARSRDNSRDTSSHKIPSQSNLSLNHERADQLKHKSESPGKNGGHPLRGGSMSPSRLRSYSPNQ